VPWTEGRIHKAGEVENRIQRCSRCGVQIVGLPAMLTGGMTPEKAMATDWGTFPVGAFVQQITSDF
jgi:hypothetical protein